MTMIAIRSFEIPRRVVLPVAGVLSVLLMLALLHRLIAGASSSSAGHSLWLALHIATVVPTVPLGAYVLVRRKGDRLHRLLGRLWALLMVVTALSSFGLPGGGQLSWIHALSVVVLVSVPRAVFLAARGDIVGHRLIMSMNYIGLLIAGFFTFLPGRLMADWLLG